MPIWPFRRRSRDGAAEHLAQPAVEGAPVPEPDVQRVAEAAAPAAPPPAPRPPTGAWRELPALHPTAGAFPLTAPVQRITEGLSSLHKPDVALGQLGHLRAADAPTGVVHGVLHPTAGTGSTSYGAQGGLDVARKPKPAEPSPAPARLRWGSAAPEAAPAQRVAEDAAPAESPGSSEATPEVAVAVQRVADAAPAAPPDRPVAVPPSGRRPAEATAVPPPAAAPPGPVQRVADAAPADASAPAVPVQRVPGSAPGVPDLPVAVTAVPQAAASTPTQGGAATPTVAPPVPARAVPAVDRPAPAVTAPALPPVVRAHRPGAPSVQRVAAAPAAAAPAVSTSPVAAATSSPGEPAPAAAAPLVGTSSAGEPAPAAAGPLVGTSSAGEPAPAAAPLVGTAPLVQRHAEGDEPAAEPVSAPSPAEPAPLEHVIPVQRVAEADTPAPPSPPVVPPGPVNPLVGGRSVVRRRIGEPLTQRPATMGPESDLPLLGVQRVADTAPPSRVATVPAPAPTLPVARRIAAVPADAEVGPSPAPAGFGAPAGGAPLAGLRSIGLQRVPDDDGPSGPPELDADGWPVPPPPPSTLRPSEPAKPLLTSVGKIPGGGPPAPVPVRRGGLQRVTVDEAVATPPPAGGGSPLGIQRAPDSVPADLADDLKPVLGTDVSRVPVHRGPEVGQAAKELQAKAFTTGGEVHLPDALGPTNSGEGRAVLAHELTHTVQQQRLGSSLPPEETPEGQALETEAKHVAGALQAPKAQRLPVQRVADTTLTHPSARVGSFGGPTTLTGPAAFAMAQHVQRAAMSAGVATAVQGPTAGVAFPSPSPVDQGGPVPLGVQRAVQIDEVVADVSPSGSTPQRGSGSSAEPSVSGPQDLDRLANDLYGRIAARLRRDLLRQRERAGRLSDLN